MQFRRFHWSLHIVIVFLTTATLFAQEPASVVMWTTYTDTKLDWLNQKADLFNESHLDYNIQIESFDDVDILLESYASEDITDVALLHLSDDYTQIVLDRQITQPISTFVADNDSILDIPVHQSDWFDTITTHATVQDQWMMIPMSVSTALAYVNVDLLAELGTDYTFTPEDWMTLELICDDIAAAIEEETIAGCVAWGDTAWIFENWLAQQNVMFLSGNNGRESRALEFDLLSTSAFDTTDFMQRLATNGYLIMGSDVSSAFTNGDIPILFADNTLGLTLDTDYTAGILPGNVDFGWSGARLDTENLWLTSAVGDDIAAAGLAFALFLTQPENAVEWHQATGSLPLSYTAQDMLINSDWAESHPEQIIALEALADSTGDYGTTAAVYGSYTEIQQNLRLGLDSIIFSDIEVMTGLESIQEFVLQLLEDYNLSNAPDVD